MGVLYHTRIPPYPNGAHIWPGYFPHACVSDFLGWWHELRAILTVQRAPVNWNVMKCPDQFHSAAWQGVRGMCLPLGKLHCWHQSWAISPWAHTHLHFTRKKGWCWVVWWTWCWCNACRTMVDKSRHLKFLTERIRWVKFKLTRLSFCITFYYHMTMPGSIFSWWMWGWSISYNNCLGSSSSCIHSNRLSFL